MKLSQIAAGLSAFILVACFAYGGWILSRWLNYSLGYEGMVRETVCEMVKPEYLKGKCNE